MMDKLSNVIYRTDNLAALVQEQVTKTPDAIAVIYDDNSQTCSTSITYMEMWNRARMICDNLRKHGVQDETVGVCLEPYINLPSVLLGVLQTSSCFYPFGLDGVGFVHQTLQRLSVQHLILDDTSLEALQSLLLLLNAKVLSCPDLLSMGIYLVCTDTNAAAKEGSHLLSVQWVPGLAYCITTSGTTGTEKLVRVPHACIVPNILDLRKEFKPALGDITFLASPLTFDPSMIDIFVTLTSGAALLIVPPGMKTLADSLLTMLSVRHKVTILQITPTLLGRFDPRKFASMLLGGHTALRVLVIGGELFPSSSPFIHLVDPDNETTIYNIYGITEMSCWASLQCAKLPKRHFQDPVPIGQALTGTRIKVVDDHGADISFGNGEIWIGGSERVCLLSDEAGEILAGGVVWRPTGDLGRMDEQGRIFCLGRNDHQIKRNGKRLNLSTLQQVCRVMECVQDCHAVYSQEHLYLFVVGSDHSGISKDEVIQRVKSHLLHMLPSQYQPNVIHHVTSMPVSKHGKLDVAALLELYEKEQQSKSSSNTLVPVEIWAEHLWKESLGTLSKEVSPSDNFLALGGDSLKAMQLAEHVEHHLGQSVTRLLEVVLSGTYEEFISLLREQSNTETETDRPKRKLAFHNGSSRKKCHASPTSLQLVREHEDEESVKGVRSVQVQDLGSQRIEMIGEQHSGYIPEIFNSSRDDVQMPVIAEYGEDVLMMPVSLQHDSTPKSVTIVREGRVNGTDQRKESIQNSPESSSIGVVYSRVHACGQSASNVPSNLVLDDFITSIGRGGSVKHHMTRAACSQYSYQKVLAVGSDTDKPHPSFMKAAENASAKSDGYAVDRGKCNCNCPQFSGTKMKITLDLEWKVNTGKCVDASPLVATTRSGKKLAFIGSHSHRFFAVDIATGDVEWCTQLGGRVEGSACLSACGCWVMVGCYDHSIYMLDAQTGEVVWQVETGDMVKCTPTTDVTSELTFCGSHDGHLYALHCQEQCVVWKHYGRGGGVFASPAVSPDGSMVLVATLAGHVHALQMVSGEAKWSADLKKPVFSSPAVDGNHVYIGCVDNGLYCLNLRSGQQQWVFNTGGPVFSSPVVTAHSAGGTVLVFGSHDSHLYCLSSCGQLLWKHAYCSTVYASPVVFHPQDVLQRNFDENKQEINSSERVLIKSCSGGSTLHVTQEKPLANGKQIFEGGSGCNNLSCLSKLHQKTHSDQTGSSTQGSRQKSASGVMVSASSSIGSGSSCCSGAETTVCSGLVACASTDGTVFILDVGTGVEVGSVKLPGDVFSSPVIVGGQLVVGCRDDFVYCYKLACQVQD